MPDAYQQNLGETFRRAQAAHRAGSLDEAERLYRAVLKALPENGDALHFLGVLEGQRGRHDAALKLIGRAIAATPGNPAAYFNRANILREAGRLNDALADYDAVTRLKPNHFGAWNNRAILLQQLERHAEAVASYDRALALDASRPDVHAARGASLLNLGRLEDAAASYQRALQMTPNDAAYLNNLGSALSRLGRLDDALACYDRAVTADPTAAQALANRAGLRMQRGDSAGALADYERASRRDPDSNEARFGFGMTLVEAKRHDEAIALFEELLARDPDYPYARGMLVHATRGACDWRNDAANVASLLEGVNVGQRTASPFALFGASDSAHTNRLCTETLTRDRFPTLPEPLWRSERYAHERIRVAYLSADFSNHATAQLMAGVFEHHDRERFDTIAISYGPDDASPMRRRLEGAFGQFIDARSLSDRAIAERLNAMEVDIAIDLKGYTAGGRPGILSFRPAPVQAQYLGFPGSMGASFIDYMIADATVIPPEHREHYREKIAYLPDSYQCNDGKRAVSAAIPTRAELGLPEQGFVFCCFNDGYKITPPMFDIWMRLLGAVEGSVLWLLQDNDAAGRNLRQEAEARGIPASRIVFAPRIAPEDHLARQKCADLFLDTYPCNAHTTASDALWVALPLLTCLGNAFPGRVAASLLNAAGVPELIAASLDDYEVLALKLARDSEALAAIKERLIADRDTCALFDTARITRALEFAYRTMHARAEAGMSPETFAT